MIYHRPSTRPMTSSRPFAASIFGVIVLRILCLVSAVRKIKTDVRFFVIDHRTGKFGHVSEKKALEAAKNPYRFSVTKISTTTMPLTR